MDGPKYPLVGSFKSKYVLSILFTHGFNLCNFLFSFDSWSECAVDNNDDDGEGRDGDEQWYLARTQDFCANVAFSLYGLPKKIGRAHV